MIVRTVRGADVGSDHHLLLARFKLRLKRHHNNGLNRRRKSQVSHLKGNTIERFRLQLNNEFKPLEDLIEEGSAVETHWIKGKEVFVTTFQDVLGENRTERKEWISQRSLDLIVDRKAKTDVINLSRTRCSTERAQGEYRTVA